MPNPSDEIKAKLDIVEVIREYIPLKAAGLNFRANCPFHREKTPSFMVSPEKQIWHCFGCGKGGDVFSFVMEIESLSFVEVLRLLAKKAGVVLRQADPALTSKRNVLLDILELSAKFYHKVLLDSPAAEPARAYLKQRALTEATIEAWQLGFSPQS
jgi:DNA primase